MSRKALMIGIDNYEGCKLNACVNDAKALGEALEYNYDDTKNFDVSFLLDAEATRARVRKSIKNLFKGNDDIALLYFSGHGIDDENDGFIVTHDFVEDDWGISMPEILKFVNKSKCKNKIVIFDCCYAGFAGTSGFIGDESILSTGTIILTASRSNETSAIRRTDTNSLFTKLFLEALNGAGSDIFGHTTPSSIYSFIDRALGSWEQRPVFKSNVDSFISLKENKQKISMTKLKRNLNLFRKADDLYQLDPSYEPTNYVGSIDRNLKPYRTEEHVKIFKELLELFRVGIIEPVDKENMYEAAMNSKACRLTSLGRYYHTLMKEKKI